MMRNKTKSFIWNCSTVGVSTMFAVTLTTALVLNTTPPIGLGEAVIMLAGIIFIFTTLNSLLQGAFDSLKNLRVD